MTTDPRIRHVATACPKCGELLDCSEDPVNGATPSEGDATICAYCLTWLVFDRALVLHLCDLDSLPAHDRAKLKSIQRRIAERRPS